MQDRVTGETIVRAPREQAFEAYTSPSDIPGWNFASDDWHCPWASVDLREGGAFSSRMEARDGRMGFDFTGTYTRIEAPERIEYAFGDRRATVLFTEEGGGTHVRVSFDPETEHSIDQQRSGWQAILDNFARYVDRRAGER